MCSADSRTWNRANADIGVNFHTVEPVSADFDLENLEWAKGGEFAFEIGCFHVEYLQAPSLLENSDYN